MQAAILWLEPTALTTMQSAAAATGNGTVLALDSKYGSVIVQVTGTFSATITFEGTLDGTNWVSVRATEIATNTVAATATAAGIYVIPAVGLAQVRARISGYVSGNVTAKGRATPAVLAQV